MGEEKKEEGKKEEEVEKKKEEVEKKDEEKEDKKKEEEEEKVAEEIVLKVDMHCEACARKVTRALKGFEGVEEVKADCKASKVVVKGKVAAADPIKVCQRIQKKSGRKVELISPLPKPDDKNNKEDDNKKEQPKPATVPEEKKQEQKLGKGPNRALAHLTRQAKPSKKNEWGDSCLHRLQPPAVITLVLKVAMHCEACAQVLQKRIRKIKGVESVTTDMGNDQVIVKGVVDPEKLVKDVYKRTGKQASIVKEEEKKDEKKEEEKKDEEKKQDDKKDESKEDDDKKTDVKKMEHWPQKHYMDYAYAHAPQMFSDENPNACSLM